MAIVAVAVAAVSAVVDAAFAAAVAAVLHLSEFTSGVSPYIFFRGHNSHLPPGSRDTNQKCHRPTNLPG